MAEFVVFEAGLAFPGAARYAKVASQRPRKSHALSEPGPHPWTDYTGSPARPHTSAGDIVSSSVQRTLHGAANTDSGR